ncbi:hypothetical protein AAFF_G00134070 [Aldrovandia affinis]|uniref:Uncharacterized protein n=1 Tax=Aldrovandia affinis TaxID=143900 RepID=A0AAD7RQ38_9TELE|nr:hypothetical protein AAFF_G00134070 [Aldrovandia affinis]
MSSPPVMETSASTATEKKECKVSSMEGNSFSDLPKKPSPSAVAREERLLINIKKGLWNRYFAVWKRPHLEGTGSRKLGCDYERIELE